MSSSIHNSATKTSTNRPSQSREAVNSFYTWVLDHFGANSLQKAKMAILAMESEKEFLRNELDAQERVIKGLTAQNSQISAQLLKLNSLLTRKGELRNTGDNATRVDGGPRPEHEQILFLVLQEIFKSSPLTIQEILHITNQQQRLLALANATKLEATRVVDTNNLLQNQINIELNASSIIIEKDRIISNLEASIDNFKTKIQMKDKHILELQCHEQENTLKLNALMQNFEELQAKNDTLNDCIIAMQGNNEELKETANTLKKRVTELEEQEHMDSSAFKELMAISVGLDTSLSATSIGLQSVQGDLEKLAAETQTSMTRLINKCDHSILTSRLIGEEKICGPDLSDLLIHNQNNNETSLLDSLQRMIAYITDPGATIDSIRAYIADDLFNNNYNTIPLSNSSLQKNTHNSSLVSSNNLQARVNKVVKSRISKSVQTDVSLSQVSKMLVNEKRLRDKISLLENRLKEREVTVQSLEEKIRNYTERSYLLNFQEIRVATPSESSADEDNVFVSSRKMISHTVEIQTDPLLSLEAPDPSWPDFQEKMNLFEATLNNLYLALQQQKAQAGPDLQIEDLATTIRTQILEAINGTIVAPVSTNDRTLDLTIITDDIVNYDRSLFHLQQKKSEQRSNSKGMFSFWK